MTNQQRQALLTKARTELRLTTDGYMQNPKGIHWRNANKHLDALAASLVAPKPPVSRVPNLGPIIEGGKSILLHDLTHPTDGIPYYPAFDDGFGDAGRYVIAPENVKIAQQSGSQGGDAFYMEGVSLIEYWIGHIALAPPTNKLYRKGERITRIAWIPSTQGGPHVHCAIDARKLTGGRVLEHHTDYSHGAPKIGVQLARYLNS